MKRFYAITLAAAAATAVVIPGSGPAAAAADPFVGMQVFDMLCEAKDGTPVNSPYAIGRCQDARRAEGFEIETLICNGLLDGTFVSGPSFARPRRDSWACIPGASA
jgi:cytochrome c5